MPSLVIQRIATQIERISSTVSLVGEIQKPKPQPGSGES